MSWRAGVLVGAVLASLLAVGCGDGSDPTATAPVTTARRPRPRPITTTTARPVTTTTLAPTTTTTTAPPRPAIDTPPRAADDPAGLAAQLALAENEIRDQATPPERLALAAWLQQVAYRRLGDHPEWDPEVLANLPAELHATVVRNAAARREVRGMHTKLSDSLPAWRIVTPAPAEELLAYYREAEAEFGVAWPYLAAINLVETGMGRIVGLSVAGAQGPMQFMPATWAAFGEGDVNNPRDSIRAAARYLAHNGFAEGNVEGSLFNYNRHPNYVRGVTAYAEEMAADARAFHAYYNWQIYYLTVAGDVLLPVGYETPERIPVADYLAVNPQ